MYVWFLIIVILSKSTGSMTTSLYLPPSVNVNTEEICNSVGEDIQKALPPEL